MAKDADTPLSAAKKALKGTNGHSLVTREKVVDLSVFTAEIEKPGLRDLAETLAGLVNDIRSGKVNADQVKMELLAYKELIEIRILDKQ